MAKDDYYAILGVSRTASAEEIKKAYRRQARKYHPDVNPGDKAAEEKFKKISEAFDILGDPEKRKVYDRFGVYSEAHAQAARAGGMPGGGGFPPIDFDFGEVGGAGGGSFRDMFADLFTSARNARPAAQPGRDIEYPLSISFEQAMEGLTATVTVPAGPGQANETIKVKIPAGVDTGSKVRMAGKGQPGTNGAPPGDLYIVTNVGEHPFFTRKGDNLYCTIPIGCEFRRERSRARNSGCVKRGFPCCGVRAVAATSSSRSGSCCRRSLARKPRTFCASSRA
jgi:curved DNA-binding protein